MAFETGGRILLQFPVRDPAYRANLAEPLIPQPPRCPAVTGIVDHKGLIAVGGNLRLVAGLLNGFDAMQNPLARRPQLDLIDQFKQLYPFAVISLRRFFLFFVFLHDRFVTGTPGV